jgi:hypothetical protein
MDSSDQTDHDDRLSPSTDTTAPNNRPEPGITNTEMKVPEDQRKAGHPTNDRENDSPESLDEDLSQGTDREEIDPDHSYDRPAIESIDKEEHGVS